MFLFFFFFIDNKDELSNWLIEPFVKQELHEGGYFEFVTVSNQLSSERKRKHVREKVTNPFVCEECGKHFSRIDSLKRHEKNYCKMKLSKSSLTLFKLFLSHSSVSDKS
ncbi:hypothetical protein ALC60_10287 [Trachymyrmex zeteki]|uniref:C2H2-type domain-containing protein n=1 Tax=Mycetomoellerius zeteki TaxID=64791 RepID=A0A151WS49_9HYME|nr:hypothetical protein ALC60_10287 [Trachymyrmex zeteki]